MYGLPIGNPVESAKKKFTFIGLPRLFLHTKATMVQIEIIETIRRGGQQHLGLLYQEYRDEFLHWISREYRLSDDDSKDVYQVAILIFYDNVRMGKLDHLASSIKTYLYGIGKNLAHDILRKQSKASPIERERWVYERLSDEVRDPEREEEMSHAVKRALEKLGQPCKRLIEMFYYDKKEMTTIAEVLNYSNAESAKNQKCECMARLRKLVDEEIGNLKTIMNHELQ